jgi:reactive intermediate/imine deaminase
MKRSTMLVTAALLVGVALGASSGGPERRHFKRTGDSVRDPLPFSDGVLAGDTLYLAGTLGLDRKTGLPPADPKEEARLALEDMKATLAEAEMTMDDLVTVQVFCADLELYDDFNQVYRSYFKEKYPARAFIGSGPLLRGGRFEIQGIAVKR